MKNKDISEFPKAGQYVVIVKGFQFMNGTSIKPGDFAEVLKTTIVPFDGEIHRYFIYLGLESGQVLELNYTLHHDKVKIVPPTKAAKVLYGTK